MKASLKFRDEQKPVLRAKVPLSILGLPFQSGIVAGESKELTLNLSTFFESGPAVKLAYRPNDSWNPFSVVVKTGTGSFGSPISSSMLMSAEFSLLRGGNPSFMLHFKPRLGDFSIKKVQSSVFDKASTLSNGVVSDDDSAIEVVESPTVNSIGFLQEKAKNAVLQSVDFAGILSGMEMSARTALPVKGRAVVNFRWGVRVPAEMKSGFAGGSNYSTSAFSFQKVPFLVMNKIGIEYIDSPHSKAEEPHQLPKAGGPDWESTNVAEVCYTVKHQLEVLQAENSLLKKAVDDLRHEIASGKMGSFSTPKYREVERNGTNSKSGIKLERRSNEKKSMEEDASEELKKALRGAVGA